MSFYRTILAAAAAIVIASPVFAEDQAVQQNNANANANANAHQMSSNEQNSSATESKVNINKASAKELMKVKGINAAKARAIVAYRKKHGFSSTEDLAKVKGFQKMKPDTLKEIEDQISVD